MAILVSKEGTVCENKSQLVAYLESGCKAPCSFKMGTEQERFIFQTSDFSPAVYEGKNTGVKALLKGMQEYGWSPVYEDDQPIALYRGDASITLEPGGQIELSGAPWSNTHQVFKESQIYNSELSKLGEQLGLHFLSLGYQPKYTQSELPWMPKQRYDIMRSYMPGQGKLGLDMMKSTCAIHVNMDFSSEADMVKKFQVALALQPLITALFANSPFSQGKANGYLSYRNYIWQHTDNDRCGNLPFVFEEGMGFESYIDYILDVPMYFVIRDNKYIDARGLSFRDFMDGKLKALPGQLPLLSDWETHLSTVFPNVRLKKHLELRGADAGASSLRVAAISALWTGLLYDSELLDLLWKTVKTWTKEEKIAMDLSVSKNGFNTPFRNKTVQDLCLWILDLSRQGLTRRDHRDKNGNDESFYLDILQELAEKGQTFAEQLLFRFNNEWQKDMDVAIRAMCKETML